MKIRIKFEKHGSMRYIGHLDVMRYFQKAFRRCDLKVEYSQGFNPHQLMSFASPLGVGLTSSGEYLDVRLVDAPEKKELLERINSVMNDEIVVSDLSFVKEDLKPSMSSLAAADYFIIGKAKYPYPSNIYSEFDKFLTQSDIMITKKTKKGETTSNIKPFLYETRFIDPVKDVIRDNQTVFDIYTDGDIVSGDPIVCFYLKASAGSVFNVKPEQVMECFYQFMGLEFQKIFYHYHRLDMYVDLWERPKETLEERMNRKRKFVSMNDYGILEKQ